MSKKQIGNREATQACIEAIDSVERKLRMIKQYLNSETGSVVNEQMVSGLFIAADEGMSVIRYQLTKIL